MKAFLLTTMILCSGAGEAFACADFSGNWQRSDGVVYHINQTGCVVRGSVVTAFDNELTANVTGNEALGSVTRTNLSNGCRTVMTARLTYRPDGNIEMAILGTDGACDLLTTYSEDFIYSKI